MERLYTKNLSISIQSFLFVGKHFTGLAVSGLLGAFVYAFAILAGLVAVIAIPGTASDVMLYKSKTLFAAAWVVGSGVSDAHDDASVQCLNGL